jgi:hypothetical protein
MKTNPQFCKAEFVDADRSGSRAAAGSRASMAAQDLRKVWGRGPKSALRHGRPLDPVSWHSGVSFCFFLFADTAGHGTRPMALWCCSILKKSNVLVHLCCDVTMY